MHKQKSPYNAKVSVREQCPHCLELFSREEIVFCCSCDAPVCPFCAEIVEYERMCPECRQKSETQS